MRKKREKRLRKKRNKNKSNGEFKEIESELSDSLHDFEQFESSGQTDMEGLNFKPQIQTINHSQNESRYSRISNSMMSMIDNMNDSLDPEYFQR